MDGRRIVEVLTGEPFNMSLDAAERSLQSIYGFFQNGTPPILPSIKDLETKPQKLTNLSQYYHKIKGENHDE